MEYPRIRELRQIKGIYRVLFYLAMRGCAYLAEIDRATGYRNRRYIEVLTREDWAIRTKNDEGLCITLKGLTEAIENLEIMIRELNKVYSIANERLHDMIETDGWM